VVPNVTIGRDCHVARAIIDSDCNIPDGLQLDGAAVEAESERLSADGIALITRAVVERAAARQPPSKIAYLRR
jgi:glucose-1-phosphate adenylyltransferase